MKRALITGISGQDGAFLSQSLLKKGWEVIGTTRKYDDANLQSLENLKIKEDIKFLECDLLDLKAVKSILTEYNPSLVFNLAAQSSVAQSFHIPRETMHFNTMSVLNLLESIKELGKDTRFYQASSSEIFGRVEKLPITYQTPKHPLSPYAISKASAFWSTVNYRESFGLKSCSGILFNHESVFRADGFFTKKIVREALEIKYRDRKEIVVGDIDISRDMGCAKEYVEAMITMALKDEMSDYLICTGKSVTLRSLIEYTLEKLELNKDVIKQDKKFFRPNEIKDIYGDPSRAKNELGWSVGRTIYQVLDEMIEFEKERMNI